MGTTGTGMARKGAIRASLPMTAAGTPIDRQCASAHQAAPRANVPPSAS